MTKARSYACASEEADRKRKHFILEKLTEKGWVGLKVFYKHTIKKKYHKDFGNHTLYQELSAGWSADRACSVVSNSVTLWTVALQALAVGFRRQEYWWVPQIFNL